MVRPAGDPQEQAQGPLGMKPALEMRRGNQQLLGECVIANAEPCARLALMGEPERMSHMGRINRREARQAPRLRGNTVT